MVFWLFKKKDPICGMNEKTGEGMRKHGKWFCSQKCLNEYDKQMEKQAKKGHSCCHQ